MFIENLDRDDIVQIELKNVDLIITKGIHSILLRYMTADIIEEYETYTKKGSFDSIINAIIHNRLIQWGIGNLAYEFVKYLFKRVKREKQKREQGQKDWIDINKTNLTEINFKRENKSINISTDREKVKVKLNGTVIEVKDSNIKEIEIEIINFF